MESECRTRVEAKCTGFRLQSRVWGLGLEVQDLKPQALKSSARTDLQRVCSIIPGRLAVGNFATNCRSIDRLVTRLRHGIIQSASISHISNITPPMPNDSVASMVRTNVGSL